jgi:EAL domain-containing protein (putative c-di-GMP-specific phosphodiesterase class I)
MRAAERLGMAHALSRKVRQVAYAGFTQVGEDHHLFLEIRPEDLLDPELLNPRPPGPIRPDRVVLELTRGDALESGKDASRRIRSLRDAGFRFAVSDVGAGYGGLSSLATVEPELVKLGVALVRDVHQSAIKQRLIRSMTDLAKDLGHVVVAQGVESDAEREAVVALGVHLLQGDLLAAPQWRVRAAS